MKVRFLDEEREISEMKVRFLDEEILTEDLMADFKSLTANDMGSLGSLLYDLELILRKEVHQTPKRVNTMSKDRLVLNVSGTEIIILIQNGKFVVKNTSKYGNFDNTVSSFRTLGELVDYIEDLMKAPMRKAA